MTTTASPEVSRATLSVSKARRDIQGLRALAVAVVVLYHLWPWRLTGGYVGVDVFFVVSGFLITAHLLREAESTGRIAVATFWARRARRLLPASFVVLLFTVIATAAVVPQSLWQQFGREIGASALYVENLLLASDSVDYLAADNAASPVQHFWSLGAEEQFYLVWPLLVVAAIALVAQRSQRSAVAIMLGMVTAVSLVVSVAWTASSPAQAYFVTPTRAWEFGLGAMLAVVPMTAARAGVRAVAAWAGVLAIGVAAFMFDAATAFPGVAALLPVGGALLVLWANGDDVRGAPSTVMSWRPIQRLGDWSYSVYLWHWPLIVLAPFVIGRDLFSLDKVVLLGLTVAVSAVSWRWVENPVRRSRALSGRRPRVTFALVGTSMVVLVGAAWWLGSEAERDIEASLAQSRGLWEQLAQAPNSALTGSESEAVAPTPCMGASVTALGGECTPTLGAGEVVPVPAAARHDSPDDCISRKGSESFEPCEFGVPRDESESTIALIGDSHAYHWLPAVDQIARDQGWSGIVMARESCPFSPAHRTLDEQVVESCARYNDQVSALLEERDDVTVVVMASFANIHFEAPEGVDQAQVGFDAYVQAIATLPDHVSQVYVIRDAPIPLPDNVTCVEQALDDGSLEPGAQCAVPQDRAVVEDLLFEAAKAQPRAQGVDLTDLYCEAGTCSPVVGNVMVYADQGHLTQTWVRSAVPVLAAQLTAVASP
ncbi:acyltransferase family protein [Demequina sp.]|uniref:acyltransferase family protein n=1 Tax=Demequina sp. TaxID=2050685 RepID=UPI003A8C24AD